MQNFQPQESSESEIMYLQLFLCRQYIFKRGKFYLT
jgi:hypothetical protein